MNIKTALLAVTAVAALLGAAIISVPSTASKGGKEAIFEPRVDGSSLSPAR